MCCSQSWPITIIGHQERHVSEGNAHPKVRQASLSWCIRDVLRYKVVKRFSKVEGLSIGQEDCPQSPVNMIPSPPPPASLFIIGKLMHWDHLLLLKVCIPDKYVEERLEILSDCRSLSGIHSLRRREMGGSWPHSRPQWMLNQTVQSYLARIRSRLELVR